MHSLPLLACPAMLFPKCAGGHLPPFVLLARLKCIVVLLNRRQCECLVCAPARVLQLDTNGDVCSTQVVAGVLQKYVNITKGFRDRLFVLADDKLVYFKVGFPNATAEKSRCCERLFANLMNLQSCSFQVNMLSTSKKC